MTAFFPMTFILGATVETARQRRAHPAMAKSTTNSSRGDLTLEVFLPNVPA
jgi:hypothetical protein